MNVSIVTSPSNGESMNGDGKHAARITVNAVKIFHLSIHHLRLRTSVESLSTHVRDATDVSEAAKTWIEDGVF